MNCVIMVGRLTPEEQRYIELGKAVEAAFSAKKNCELNFIDHYDKKGYIVPGFIGSPDELLAWHRAEVRDES